MKYVKIGTYQQQPLIWRVLEEKNNRILILCEYILEEQPYHKKREAVSWKTSTIRSWLNHEFYEKTFSQQEKDRILISTIRNPDNWVYKSKGGCDTKDRLFFLSLSQIHRYFLSNQPKAIRLDGKKDYYWLRSPGSSSYTASYINKHGMLQDFGLHVDYRNGIRPAMWIKK